MATPRVFKAGSFWRFRYPGTLNYGAFLTKREAIEAATDAAERVEALSLSQPIPTIEDMRSA